MRIDNGRDLNRLPATVHAGEEESDLPHLLATRGSDIQALLCRHGAVLFRGFAVADDVAFRSVMEALSTNILDYNERSSPRTQVSKGVYTSTDYPASERILPHNEQSYSNNWPMKIVFCCAQPATRGGRTPLVDSRKLLARLSPQTLSPFEELGVMYVRNYLPGISLSWQEAFQTARPEDVDDYCKRADIEAEWLGRNHLRTRQVRGAVHRHPLTDERTWFNHAHFFHINSLSEEVREGLLAALDEEDLPYNTYYGDGSAIDPTALADITSAYEAETVGFDWVTGDVLVVENMITAHAREPFEGPRTILTAMADPIQDVYPQDHAHA